MKFFKQKKTSYLKFRIPIVIWKKRFTGIKIFAFLSKTFSKSQKTCEFEVYTQSKNARRKMLQTNLTVIAIGEPNLDILSDGEKRSFFETLFSRIVEIHKEKHTEAIAIQKI